MSEDPPLVRRLRNGYAAWNRTGDIAPFLAELDPAVELVVPERGPEGAMTFRGHDGVAQWAQGMADVWRDVQFDPVEVEIDATGRHALVLVKVTTEGRTSGVELEGSEAHVLTLGPAGKVVRIQGFGDPEAARAVFEATDPGL